MKSGTYVRSIRQKSHLKLRELSALTDIDPTLLSKIERLERLATREQIVSIQTKLQLDETIMTLWVADSNNSNS